MNYLLSAPEEKLNKEAFGELPGPRGIIVSSLCRSTNQRFAVICKGDFPFPFQTSDQNIELEVLSLRSFLIMRENIILTISNFGASF